MKAIEERERDNRAQSKDKNLHFDPFQGQLNILLTIFYPLKNVRKMTQKQKKIILFLLFFQDKDLKVKNICLEKKFIYYTYIKRKREFKTKKKRKRGKKRERIESGNIRKKL